MKSLYAVDRCSSLSEKVPWQPKWNKVILYNVGVKNGAVKDTALSRGNLDDFQSLEAPHDPWNLKKSGKCYQGLLFTQTAPCPMLMASGQVRRDKTHPLLTPLRQNSWSLSLRVAVLGTNICSRGLHCSYILSTTNTHIHINDSDIFQASDKKEFSLPYLALHSQRTCWH